MTDHSFIIDAYYLNGQFLSSSTIRCIIYIYIYIYIYIFKSPLILCVFCFECINITADSLTC